MTAQVSFSYFNQQKLTLSDADMQPGVILSRMIKSQIDILVRAITPEWQSALS